MIVGKLSVIVNDIPGAALCAYASAKDLLLNAYSGLAVCGAYICNAIAISAVYVYNALVMCLNMWNLYLMTRCCTMKRIRETQD